MTVEPKRIKINRGASIETIAKEAEDAPVIFEIDGRFFEMSIKDADTITINSTDEEVVPEGEPFSIDDPLWDIVGMASSEGEPNDIARNKHKYLTDAYFDLHQGDPRQGN